MAGEGEIVAILLGTGVLMTLGIVALAGALAAAHARELIENELHGELPNVPEGLRPARKNGGEDPSKADGRAVRTLGHVWGHDGAGR